MPGARKNRRCWLSESSIKSIFGSSLSEYKDAKKRKYDIFKRGFLKIKLQSKTTEEKDGLQKCSQYFLACSHCFSYPGVLYKASSWRSGRLFCLHGYMCWSRVRRRRCNRLIFFLKYNYLNEKSQLEDLCLYYFSYCHLCCISLSTTSVLCLCKWPYGCHMWVHCSCLHWSLLCALVMSITKSD